MKGTARLSPALQRELAAVLAKGGARVEQGRELIARYAEAWRKSKGSSIECTGWSRANGRPDMSTQRILAAERVRLDRYRPPVWHSHIHGSEFAWAVAFIVPYVGVLLAFAVFPIAYGFWMASDPALYATLFSSEEYVDALIST
ncbi:MAG TPA: hypothetical protein VFE73_19465, partial [Reyranella sp.]|nr:hypothetical protein [Reyranella sp.]